MIPTHNIIKSLRTENKGRIIMSCQKKNNISVKGIIVGLRADFLADKIRQLNDTFTFRKKKTAPLESRSLRPACDIARP
jgi:hypothetical protein